MIVNIVKFGVIVQLALLPPFASGECANACSGHGRCSLFDMCICYRNWQANDCSERICSFGRAFSDTPKGDLDGDGQISGPSTITIENSFTYPFGTTEGFPQMVDSDLNVLQNTAHEYAECSNAGTCNRDSGECECYEGFIGASCQRLVCPGFIIHPSGDESTHECSGHGVCVDLERLADHDGGSVYKLWDRHSTFGCECDPGYTGGDCSQRECGFGVDVLYNDDVSAVKYAVFNFAVLTTSTTIDMVDDKKNKGPGKWAIIWYDPHGDDWITPTFGVDATCETIVKAFESFPNSVIPKKSLVCYRHMSVAGHPLAEVYTGVWNVTFQSKYDAHTISEGVLGTRTEYVIYRPTFWEAGFGNSYDAPSATDTVLSGYIYRLEFTGVLGYLKQPRITTMTEGYRSTLYSPGGKLFTSVWTNGEQGEFWDHIADHCKGLTVSALNDGNGNWFIGQLTGDEVDLLRQCLGDADGDPGNNIELYNWDYGDEYHPHLVKLIPSSGTMYNWGFYCVLWYDTSFQAFSGGVETKGTFRLVNPLRSPQFMINTIYDIYCTNGVLELTTMKSEVVFDFASNTLYTLNANYGINGDKYDGDVSCENWDKSDAEQNEYMLNCLEKNDLFMFFDFYNTKNNPPYLNMYKVQRIYALPGVMYPGDDWDVCSERDGTGACASTIPEGLRASTSAQYRTNRIITDLSTNWAHDLDVNSQFRLYKFTPNPTTSYQYIAPCSNRGMCNHENGLCECSSGYAGQTCSEQIGIML